MADCLSEARYKGKVLKLLVALVLKKSSDVEENVKGPVSMRRYHLVVRLIRPVSHATVILLMQKDRHCITIPLKTKLI